jgi:GNAT superfamily N-acetyltransferase
MNPTYSSRPKMNHQQRRTRGSTIIADGSADRPGNFQFAGYYPGVVGRLTQLHAVYYHDNWNFDITFETQVGRELSEFFAAFDRHRDGFWAAVPEGDLAGAVAIDGRLSGSDGARLRWFIVDTDFHGRGIGRALLRQALRFCREVRHPRVFLWTFEGLDMARRLYEQEGFVLSEEHDVEQWGRKIREQKFELILDTDAF